MSGNATGLHSIGDLTASADCSAKQYCFAKVSGVRTLTFTAAATDRPLGIIQNKPLSGGAVDLGIDGESQIVVGAAVTAGQELMSNAAGQGIPATGSGAIVGAIALETATTLGQQIAVLITPNGRTLP